MLRDLVKNMANCTKTLFQSQLISFGAGTRR